MKVVLLLQWSHASWLLANKQGAKLIGGWLIKNPNGLGHEVVFCCNGAFVLLSLGNNFWASRSLRYLPDGQSE